MNEFKLKVNTNSFIDFLNFLSSHFLSFKTNGPLKSGLMDLLISFVLGVQY
jgi:hypothetical protein